MTPFGEKCRTVGVVRKLDRVLATVELDDELLFATAEVHDVRTDWNLARELVTEEALVSQSRPHPAFGVGLASSQAARVIAG